MSTATTALEMTAGQLYRHLRHSWQTNRRPSEVAREIGAPLADITAFYSCMYSNTRSSLDGAEGIARVHVALRQQGRR